MKSNKSYKDIERIIGIILFICLFLNSVSFANEALEINFNIQETHTLGAQRANYNIQPTIEISEIFQIELKEEINQIIQSKD